VEAGIVLAVALAALAVVTVVVLARRRRAPAYEEDLLLDPDDLAELDQLLDQVAVEERPVHDSLLKARLDLLVSRGVPVRRVVAAGAPGAATVGFADGTAVTVTSLRAAESGVLLMHASRGRVLLRGYRHDEQGRLLLRFGWSGRRADVEVVALGLEQPP
jgi:hypothetical protein